VGTKKTGKTATGLALTRELQSRGLKVAVVKHTQHHFDKQGTDTDRYRELGATVIGVSADETMMNWPSQRFVPDLLPLADADVLVMEGGKELGWLPRVLCLNDPGHADGLQPELALATCGTASLPGLPHATDMRALADLLLERGFTLPGLDCGACGMSGCAEMAGEIVARRKTPGDCVATGGGLRITVNGSPLGINAFAEKFLKGGMIGMLTTLKGFVPGKIVIELDP
jgi:molybdopterin-guanine dinucleotide biosynthesis protein B